MTDPNVLLELKAVKENLTTCARDYSRAGKRYNLAAAAVTNPNLDPGQPMTNRLIVDVLDDFLNVAFDLSEAMTHLRNALERLEKEKP
jgi:hypothetical protein